MRRHPWLTAAIVLVVLLGVVHFCLEWRAEQRWQRYAAEARARGVRLMLPDFARPEIPDAQNFAMLPMMQKAFRGEEGQEGFKPPFARSDRFLSGLAEDSLALRLGLPATGERWEAIAQSFREAKLVPVSSGDPARDVLAGLEHYTPEFQQWAEWRQRPRCQIPDAEVDRTDRSQYLHRPAGRDRVLKTFANAVRLFGLRQRAHLALGDPLAAASDFQEGMQAYHELREEPGLEVAYCRLAILAGMLDAVGDGLRRRAWAAQSLSAIQAEIESVPIWGDYRYTLAYERAALNTRMEALLNTSGRERRRIREQYTHPLAPLGNWVADWLPRRVFRNNQWQRNQYLDELLARVDPSKPAVNFDEAISFSPPTMDQPLDDFLASVSGAEGGVVPETERSCIAQQILLDEARLVCALERCRLAQGTYPAALADLVPQFITDLPRDPYARAPYHYQRLEGGTFLLYGVGANRKDDGGQASSNVPDYMQPDAVWPYAPPATP